MKRNAPPAVEARDLTMRFGSFTAVDRVSFAVQPGEIFGFLGANGAGKTTTIRMLCGLLVPTSGEICFSGLDCHADSLAIKRRVGYMSQRFTLYDDLTVLENLNFTASLRKLDSAALPARIRELFAFVAFDHPTDTLVRDLPVGLKQQLSLAAALLHNPEIIFLDEPTAGVSPVVRARFWQLIRKLARAGKTLFVTTHYLDEAEQCHRIALMRAGRIIALDTPAGLKRSTFPETMVEIAAGPDGDLQWIESLELDPRVGEVQPYGLRYHVLVNDESAWKNIARRMPKKLKVRPIQPSLEDVFIRLVEGADR